MVWADLEPVGAVEPGAAQDLAESLLDTLLGASACFGPAHVTVGYAADADTIDEAAASALAVLRGASPGWKVSNWRICTETWFNEHEL